MPIFEIGPDSIERLKTTSFGIAGLLERADLQRLLRDKIDVVAQDVLVICEEFGEWTESRRRIDLLGTDKNANLVVIELKRTEDGGHMELQALRYAAMVSTLTAERAVDIYGKYLTCRGLDDDPEQALLDFLEWDEVDEDKFAQDVRIVLVSANFSREMTTAVLWLNEKEVDIRCVRIRPYSHAGQTLIDVQQVIPLPETANYQVQVREKKRQKRASRSSNADFTRYDVTVCGNTHRDQWKRNAILIVVKSLNSAGVALADVRELFRSLGRGNSFIVVDKEIEDVNEFRLLASEILTQKGKIYNDRRWHTSSGDLMISQGRTYSLTNQWGRHWPKFMETLQQRYPQIDLQYAPALSAAESD